MEKCAVPMTKRLREGFYCSLILPFLSLHRNTTEICCDPQTNKDEGFLFYFPLSMIKHPLHANAST